MARPRILTDEQRKINKQRHNNNPENIEKRRVNSLIYYEKKKLVEWKNKHGSDKGFNYKYLNRD